VLANLDGALSCRNESPQARHKTVALSMVDLELWLIECLIVDWIVRQDQIFLLAAGDLGAAAAARDASQHRDAEDSLVNAA